MSPGGGELRRPRENHSSRGQVAQRSRWGAHWEVVCTSQPCPPVRGQLSLYFSMAHKLVVPLVIDRVSDSGGLSLERSEGGVRDVPRGPGQQETGSSSYFSPPASLVANFVVGSDFRTPWFHLRDSPDLLLRRQKRQFHRDTRGVCLISPRLVGVAAAVPSLWAGRRAAGSGPSTGPPREGAPLS